jgi:hypothetical protein
MGGRFDPPLFTMMADLARKRALFGSIRPKDAPLAV